MSTCLTSICLLYNSLPKSHCTEMNLFCMYNYVPCPGYEDENADNPSLAGRLCSACPDDYCSGKTADDLAAAILVFRNGFGLLRCRHLGSGGGGGVADFVHAILYPGIGGEFGWLCHCRHLGSGRGADCLITSPSSWIRVCGGLAFYSFWILNFFYI